MTKWKEMLHKEQKYFQELLNQLEKQEKRNLAGRLRISSDRGYPRYYHCKGDDKQGEYISKKNLELARQLAQKEYDEKLQKYIQKNGLCSICKTSYVDCERMQSNFRCYPKGSSCKGNLVIKCPKFTKY